MVRYEDQWPRDGIWKKSPALRHQAFLLASGPLSKHQHFTLPYTSIIVASSWRQQRPEDGQTTTKSKSVILRSVSQARQRENESLKSKDNNVEQKDDVTLCICSGMSEPSIMI